jgi:hypothetical protein
VGKMNALFKCGFCIKTFMARTEQMFCVEVFK